jgi:serine/threonine protein kinase
MTPRQRPERLTETGLSLGTPFYMSPEQATGSHEIGPATDIYALGCVLYEMLVGEPPHSGITPQAVLAKIITGEATSVTGQRRSVPLNVDGAIAKAIEKLPADRFGRRKVRQGFHGPGLPLRGAGRSPWSRWNRDRYDVHLSRD